MTEAPASENATAHPPELDHAGDPEPKKGLHLPLGTPSVVVHRVSMRYRVPTAVPPQSGAVVRRVRQWAGWHPKVTVKALSAVSLVARAGESVGIVGHNGSGKSTLLRVIAGLATPTRGTVLATSTPSFLGVNAALLPDLPGIDNARLGLLAMGKTPDEVDQALPDVLDFADIGPAIHLPMKTYSSGMGSRLRFAIAAAAQPQILLIDEALATGDAASKERSETRMNEIRKNAGTVFLVSHAAQTIEEMCTRAVWLHKGEVIGDGPAYETARAYRWWAWNLAKGETDIATGLVEKARRAYRETVISAHDSETERYIARHGPL